MGTVIFEGDNYKIIHHRANEAPNYYDLYMESPQTGTPPESTKQFKMILTLERKFSSKDNYVIIGCYLLGGYPYFGNERIEWFDVPNSFDLGYLAEFMSVVETMRDELTGMLSERPALGCQYTRMSYAD